MSDESIEVVEVKKFQEETYNKIMKVLSDVFECAVNSIDFDAEKSCTQLCFTIGNAYGLLCAASIVKPANYKQKEKDMMF